MNTTKTPAPTALSITIKTQSVYGRTLYYPVCLRALTFASIAKSKTLSYEDLKAIKELGYTIQEQTTPLPF